MVAFLTKADWESALSNLEAFCGPGGDVICPVAIKSIKPRHRKSATFVETRIPLLLGYVFFRCSADADWRHALLLHGVQAVLRSGEVPVTVPPHVVAGLAPAGVVPLGWEGRTVEFVDGPLTGYWGTFLNGKVSVDFFGRQTLVGAHPVSLKLK
jgi:hypothetical protein